MSDTHSDSVTQSFGNRHDYLPAAGHDALLPAYDLLTRVLGTTKIYATLLEHARIAAGETVLEIGCGTGNLTILAKRAQPAADLIGTDPDPKALARATGKTHGVPGIRFERAYGQDLPVPDSSVDKVLSSMMFHHLDEDVKTAVAVEVLRILRPGGHLYLADVGGDMTRSDGLGARFFLRSHHVDGNLGNRIPHLLESAGFSCTVTSSVHHRILGRITHYRATRPA